MDQEAIQPILDELFSSIEPLEAQSAALLQFLKAKGLTTDEELAPFLEQAANAANVRWLAVRVRMTALIANLMKPEEKETRSAQAVGEKNAHSTAAPAAEKDRLEPQSESSQDAGAEEKGQAEPKSTSSKKDRAKTQAESPTNTDVESAA
jgi:hypothetical protein